MTCTDPIDAAVLADYWLAALAQPEEEAIEEHLFACDECGTRLRTVIALAEGVRTIAREGSLRMVVSDSLLERAAQRGMRVKQYTPPAGGGVQCTVTPEDDLLVARLAADLTGAQRIDLCLCDERGAEQMRLADIPVHSQGSEVIYQESITHAKNLPTCTMIARLVAREETGGERLLGEYTFHHTRSMPATEA